MIGRMIDRAALTLVGCAGLYLFFLNAGLGVVASCALTFVCATLARYLWRHRSRRKKITASRAEAALMAIAMMETAAAVEALRALTGRSDAVFLLRHPDGTLTLNELYALWREKGDGFAMVATCAAEDAVAGFAKSRGISVTDKGGLLKRIRQTGLYVPEDAPPEPAASRLKRAWRMLLARPVRARTPLYALSLLAMYIATGRALCLFCALGLLGVTGAKVIERYG